MWAYKTTSFNWVSLEKPPGKVINGLATNVSLLCASVVLSITLPFGGLCKALDLSVNHLSDLPVSICGMTKLEVLNVSQNRLITFPDILSRCNSLRILDMSLNQLTSFPPDLALQCINLQSFLVDGNPAASSILHQSKAANFHQPEKACHEKKETNPAGEVSDEEPSKRSHKRVRK